MRNDQFEQKVTLARLRREANRGRREGRFEIGDWKRSRRTENSGRRRQNSAGSCEEVQPRMGCKART